MSDCLEWGFLKDVIYKYFLISSYDSLCFIHICTWWMSCMHSLYAFLAVFHLCILIWNPYMHCLFGIVDSAMFDSVSAVHLLVPRSVLLVEWLFKHIQPSSVSQASVCGVESLTVLERVWHRSCVLHLSILPSNSSSIRKFIEKLYWDGFLIESEFHLRRTYSYQEMLKLII